MSSSSGSTQQIQIQIPSHSQSQSPGGSDEGSLQPVAMDQRKRKRMESNRESARRSRERKQKHLDDLVDQVSRLEKENKHLNATIHGTSQEFLSVEAENSVLRAQVMELTRRLQSLDEILRNMNNIAAASDPYDLQTSNGSDDSDVDVGRIGDGFVVNPWMMNMLYQQTQPIMATADAFQYC